MYFYIYQWIYLYLFVFIRKIFSKCRQNRMTEHRLKQSWAFTFFFISGTNTELQDWKEVLFFECLGGCFFSSDSYGRQKWSVSSALDMDSARFTCGILVLGTKQLCFWSPASQFKQCWSFLLASFTKCQFCVIFLIFDLPIKCLAEFFICPLIICQVMMFFQSTIFVPS